MVKLGKSDPFWGKDGPSNGTRQKKVRLILDKMVNKRKNISFTRKCTTDFEKNQAGSVIPFPLKNFPKKE